MKIKITLLTTMVAFSFSAIAQNKEIKQAEKIYYIGKPQKAKWFLTEAEKNIGDIKGGNLINFYFLKGMVFSHGQDSNLKALKKGILSVTKAKKVQDSIKVYKYSKSIDEGLVTLSYKIEGIANNAIKSKDYVLSSNAFYTLYEINPKDTLSLYNSALSSKEGGQLQPAINKLNRLFQIGYTGIQKEYFATNIATGANQKIASKADLDALIKRGEYKDPKIGKSNSKKGEIIETLATIYLKEGKEDKFNNLYQKAIKKYPNDPKIKDSQARIFFNEGVKLSNAKKETEAIAAYNKALKVDPNHKGANLNIAAILLAKDTKLVNQINASNDTKLRNQLDLERMENYKNSIPYLEKYLEVAPNDKSIGNTLLSIYKQVKSPKAAALEAKLK